HCARMKIWCALFIIACGSNKVIPGPTGPAGAAGAAGQDGQTGVPGPVDTTAPAAASGLWLQSIPGAPGDLNLGWANASGGPALSSVKVYRDTDTPTTASPFTTVPGDASTAPVHVVLNTGVVHFAVAPVSYTGVEAPLSDEYALDSS